MKRRCLVSTKRQRWRPSRWWWSYAHARAKQPRDRCRAQGRGATAAVLGPRPRLRHLLSKRRGLWCVEGCGGRGGGSGPAEEAGVIVRAARPCEPHQAGSQAATCLRGAIRQWLADVSFFPFSFCRPCFPTTGSDLGFHHVVTLWSCTLHQSLPPLLQRFRQPCMLPRTRGSFVSPSVHRACAGAASRTACARELVMEGGDDESL